MEKNRREAPTMAGGERILVDGQCFRSEREFQLYSGLKKLMADGRVRKLEIYPNYPLIVNQVTVATYAPTFRFIDQLQQQERFVHVVKSSNPLRSLKQKLFEAIYGVGVEEWS